MGGPEEQKAFDTMKALVALEPVIAQPLLKGTFCIEVDASGFALGGVLLQHHPDSKWHPVTFISWVMSLAELNYDIYDKELLVNMYALDEWQPYLLHATKPFEIWMVLKTRPSVAATDYKCCSSCLTLWQTLCML